MNWLRNLLGVGSANSGSRAAAPRPRVQLGVESLEGRALLSGSPLPTALHVSLPPVNPVVIHLPTLPPVHTPGGSQAAGSAATTTVTIDPCSLGSEDQLRQLAAAALAGRKLHESRHGQSVTVADLKPVNVSCPDFTTEIRAKIRYKKTRGAPQFSISGQIRFSVQAAVRVTLQGGQVTHAELVPSNVRVLGLNLKRVPNWLDNSTKVPNWLSNQLTAEPIDITPLVQAYMNQGGPGAFA